MKHYLKGRNKPEASEILIVGTVPPSAGVGGVTIHVDRLLYWLAVKGQSVALCDYKTQSIIEVCRHIARHNVIHIHPSNPMFRLFLVVFAKLLGKGVIFTVHGDLGRFSSIKNYFDRLAVKWSDVPIVINEGSYWKALTWNASARLMSAYLPPYAEGTVPEHVYDEIDQERNNGKIIVATNASARSYTSDGREIYGIDFLVNYFSAQNDACLFVSDPSSQYVGSYKGREIKNVFFITEEHSFYALLKHSDIMVRATATDGDSLSIREALDLNIKVLATDCVARPEGVCLFKYNDSASLDSAMRAQYKPMDRMRQDIIGELITLYNSFM